MIAMRADEKQALAEHLVSARTPVIAIPLGAVANVLVILFVWHFPFRALMGGELTAREGWTLFVLNLWIIGVVVIIRSARWIRRNKRS
jgi:hypothetical protein